MRFIRLISALLFALVMGVATLAVLWTFALKKAETTLHNALAEIFGENVQYSTVLHVYDPQQIHLIVHDLIIQHEIMGKTLSVKLDRVDVLRDFYGDYRLVLELPKDVNFLVQAASRTQEFSLKLEGGEIALLRPAGEWELQLSTRVAQLFNQMEEQALLKTGDIYVTLQHRGSATLFEGGVKRIEFPEQSLDRAFIKVVGTQVEQLLLEGVIGLAQTGTLEGAKKAMLTMLRTVPPGNRTFEVLNLHLAPTAERWIALAGTVDIDGRLRPAGEWMVSTNQTQWFLEGLARTEGIKAEVLQSRDFQRELDARGGVETFDASVRLGDVRLNGYAIGKLEPLR